MNDEIRVDLDDQRVRKIALWHPDARDVPHYRDELYREWGPHGKLARLAPTLARASAGGQKFIPRWEQATAGAAAMWFVGADMCDLLTAAAPTLPPMSLRPGDVPDAEGLVVFERQLEGLDADKLQLGPVHVAAYLWGQGAWQYNGDPILAVTVYGSMARTASLLVPLGSLIWPYGRTADDPLADDEYGNRLSDETVASMVEDRRRLMALWLLSAQTTIATSRQGIVGGRGAARRQVRTGRDQRVRVVHLRSQVPRDPAADAHPGRTYRHRWLNAGYWKRQHYGPQGALRRPVYINPHIKGPEGAPLLDSPKVKSWTR